MTVRVLHEATRDCFSISELIVWDRATGEARAQRRLHLIERRLRSLEHRRHRVDLDPAPVGQADHLVQVAGRVLDVGGRVRRDPLVQHRLVVETRKDRDVGRPIESQPVQLDGEDGGERAQRVDELLAVEAGGRCRRFRRGHRIGR
jgi:hypothetical protein